MPECTCVSPVWVSFPLSLLISVFLSRCLSCFTLSPDGTQELSQGSWTWQPQPPRAGDLTFRTSADVFVADLPQVRSLCGQVVEGGAPPGCERRRVPGFGLQQRSWSRVPQARSPALSAPTGHASQAAPHRSSPPGPAQPRFFLPIPFLAHPKPLQAHPHHFGHPGSPRPLLPHPFRFLPAPSCSPTPRPLSATPYFSFPASPSWPCP